MGWIGVRDWKKFTNKSIMGEGTGHLRVFVCKEAFELLPPQKKSHSLFLFYDSFLLVRLISSISKS
jgi:hypothetical protein